MSSAVSIQKPYFLMQTQDINQNSFSSGTKEYKAMQEWADAHHQKCLYGKLIALKTT